MQEVSRRFAANQCTMPPMNGHLTPSEVTRTPFGAEPAPAARADAVRGAGGWLPWAGLALAIIWWGSVAAALVTVLDVSALGRQPPITLAAGALIALMPGFLILMAGFMAREGARAAAANELVLQASEKLLDPAARAGSRAESLAAQMAASASEVDRAMNHALSAMKAMSEEIGDERMRLESVSYAASDNARDLAERLSQERAGLEEIARQLRAQTEEIAQAIPRQAEAMIESTRQAAREVGQADEALDARLQQMRENSAHLSGELARLDQLAAGAQQQSEALMFAISRVEEKLEKSRSTVDAALRSGEMAAAAAGTTGDAIQTAADNAIAGARQAQKEIETSTRSAHQEAARALAALQQRAEDVSAAIRAAGMAARAETDITERRLSQVGSAFRKAVDAGTATATRADVSNGAAVSAQPAMPARTSVSTPQRRVPGHDESPAPNEAPAPIARRDVAAPSRQLDDDLFEASPAVLPPPPQNWTGSSLDRMRDEPVAPTSPTPPGIGVYDQGPFERDAHAHGEPEPFDPLEDTQPSQNAASNGEMPPAPRGDAAWTSILSDMDRSETGHMPREDIAESVIQRLEHSGIALASIFRPRDKKKIAVAARRGETPRRTAILSTARDEVDRVSKRLNADDELMQLALDFLSMEAPDAIAALDRTQKSNRNASPRLSAFLLLDAAMGDLRAAA